MKPIRTLLLAALLIPALPAQAAEEPSDASLGHVLTLVHMFVRIAAESDSSQISLRRQHGDQQGGDEKGSNGFHGASSSGASITLRARFGFTQ